MTFSATCKGTSTTRSASAAAGMLDAGHNPDERGYFDTLTFTEPAAFEAHARAHGARPLTPASRLIRLRKAGPSNRKAFAPETGDVGSWVEWTVWNELTGRHDAVLAGQVWSVIRGGKYPRVYVADGSRFHDRMVSELRPATDPSEQLALATVHAPSSEAVWDGDAEHAACEPTEPLSNGDTTADSPDDVTCPVCRERLALDDNELDRLLAP